jgi:hypothetical protein
MEINGLKVIDTTRRLRLRISPEDVRKGKTKDPGGCAAARCAIRSIPGVIAARIHIGRTYLQIRKKWVRFHTPQSLRTEIVGFDRHGTFEPGDYVLTPMQVSHRGNSKRKGGDQPRKATGKKRGKYHHVTGVRAFGANR